MIHKHVGAPSSWRIHPSTAVVLMLGLTGLILLNICPSATEEWRELARAVRNSSEIRSAQTWSGARFTYGWPVPAWSTGQERLFDPGSSWVSVNVAGVLVNCLSAIVLLCIIAIVCESLGRHYRLTLFEVSAIMFLSACLIWWNTKPHSTQAWKDICAAATRNPQAADSLCSPDVYFRYGWPMTALETGQTFFLHPETRWHRWVPLGIVANCVVGLVAVLASVLLWRRVIGRHGRKHMTER
jgi:hypothetical protein